MNDIIPFLPASSDQTRAVSKCDPQKRASPLVVCIALVGRLFSLRIHYSAKSANNALKAARTYLVGVENREDSFAYYVAKKPLIFFLLPHRVYEFITELIVVHEESVYANAQ